MDLEKRVSLIEERNKRKVQIIRPGLTGYAQINGRDKVLIEEKADLDKHYLNRFSLWLDIKIIFLTFLGPFLIKTFWKKNKADYWVICLGLFCSTRALLCVL